VEVVVVVMAELVVAHQLPHLQAADVVAVKALMKLAVVSAWVIVQAHLPF
jgi:hypothetical protein